MVKRHIVFIMSILLNALLIGILAFFVLTRTNILDKITGNDPSDFESDMYVETVSKFENITLTEADIVFMGDSIVGRGLWNEYFNDFVVANRGVGTDTTFGMVNRVDQVINLNPDKVFILGGINDLTNGYDLDVVTDNYDSILSSLNGELPNAEIYVQSILPIQESKRDVKNTLIESFNQELYDLSERYETYYIDLYSEFINDAGQLKEDFTIDGTHLTGLGYAKWIDLIDDYVYD